MGVVGTGPGGGRNEDCLFHLDCKREEVNGRDEVIDGKQINI